MATGSGRLPAVRSGVDFTVQLDVLGARQSGAAVICVMTGRDIRSGQTLVPDRKVLDRGFHDVTLVDVNHVDGPEVPVAELDTL